MTFKRIRLGDLVHYLQRGKSPSYSESGRVRVLNQKCVRWRGFDLQHARRIDDSSADQLQPVRLLQPGDVLVNSTGEGTIGRANVWSTAATGEWVVDSHVTIIRTSDALDNNWIKYWLESPEGQDFVTSSKTGATKQTELSAAKLRDCLVPAPPLKEQRRIVARIKECMERVEEIDSLRRETVQEAIAVLPSVLNEVFTLQASQAPVMTIGKVAMETRYGTSHKCHTEPLGLPILRIPNVARGAVNLDDLKYCSLTEAEAERVRLSPGDLLFVRTNGSRDLVGRCAVFDMADEEPSYGFASYLIRVRVDQTKVLPRYLAYFLNSTNGRSELDNRRRTSAGQFNINSENLRSIPFPVPSIAVQELLLEQMEQREVQANQLLSELKSASAESEGMREAILRKAFAGEL